ncbi:hypothetical protein EJB05_42310 [Eragrostis curvula]|uniref:BZIP domain-containing protein n=1 Tax=Eragrostis curvula TaxID=38414 RepID=A0A5J9TC01_9POAL|nr:hypothetical protein EJB05_42310 [Eragrostis curvula]
MLHDGGAACLHLSQLTCVASLCTCTTKQRTQSYLQTKSMYGAKATSNMCSGSWNRKKHQLFLVLKQQQKPHVSVVIRRKRLRLRWRAGAETMEMVNLKLYLENRCIIAENERLREKANALRRENLALRENLSKTVAAELPAAGARAA